MVCTKVVAQFVRIESEEPQRCSQTDAKEVAQQHGPRLTQFAIRTQIQVLQVGPVVPQGRQHLVKSLHPKIAAAQIEVLA